MSLATDGKLRCPCKGQFRVVVVDTFEGWDADRLIGDYLNLTSAKRAADLRGDVMHPAYVYDDKGELVYQAGKR